MNNFYSNEDRSGFEEDEYELDTFQDEKFPWI
jgi:hypothetical protein